MTRTRSYYSHDEQPDVLRANLQTARVFGGNSEDEGDLVGAGAPAGLPHGALASVHAQNVEVRDGRHYWCRSHSYTIEQITQQGDGHPIDDNVDTHVEVSRVPADGFYDTVFNITNNNGTLAGEMVSWFRPGTREKVRATRKVEGAELVEV